MSQPLPYPPTERQEIVETLHGIPVADPYRWLEDATSERVQAWMTAQDAYARSLLGRLPHRAAFLERLSTLAYLESLSPPIRRGSRYFYWRHPKESEKALFCYREGRDGAEHVLLDPNTLSEDGSISLGVVVPNWDGSRVAYALRERGGDAATLYVMDVATRTTFEHDRIEGAKYAHPAWTPDGSGFYYTGLPTDPTIPLDQLPGYAEIRYHKLGTPQSEDRLVYPRTGDPTRFLGVQLSRDGRWLLVYDQRGWTAVDIYVRDLHQPAGAFWPLVRGRDADYSVAIWQNIFYVTTNDGAPRGKVFRVDPRRPARSHWRVLLRQKRDATLQGVSIVGGCLAATYLRNVSTEVRLFTLDGHALRRVALPDIGSSSGLIGLPDDDEAYFTFSSFTIPPQIYRTSVATGETKLWHQVDVPVDPSPLMVDQVWYLSKDGTKVPMFLVHRKGLLRNGQNPTLLTGYGGFNISQAPGFSAFRYAWFERGGVLAIPNLRGGGEFGEAWHRAGMRAAKQNVFDDFIAAAEWLIAQGITCPEKLAIQGGSNGGLLVGAAMTQRPDLFRAVVCAVPLLDMVRYHRFGSGRTWIDEYGSADQPDQFAVLYAYSPYHRMRPGVRYPALLMLSADNDDRVDPMHARKFTALAQWAQSTLGEESARLAAERPAIIRIERNAGHGGADLRRQAIEQSADVFAFLTWQLGMS